MVCAHCRQGISGQYLRVGRLAFHPEHFLCASCGQAIKGSYNTHQGRCFHPACYTEDHAPRCAHCQRAISGKYVMLERKALHNECARPYMEAHNPPCAQCAKPLLDRHVTHEGRKFHPDCFSKHVAIACSVCRQGIIGEYLTDYWGHSYHAAHAREFATCLYCSRLLHPTTGGGGGLVYPDGRAICRVCHKTAVHRDTDGRRTVERMRATLAGWGVDLGDIQVPVKFVDRNQLAGMLARGPHQHFKRVSGFASMNWERMGREVRNKQATIYLLTGMPLGWLEGTAAHELMHVWNFHNGPQHSFALEEGSCNYMSFRIHEAQQGRGDAMAAYHIDALMKDPDPAYGVGFRKVRKYVDRHGFDRMLSLLKSSRDFPVLDGLF